MGRWIAMLLFVTSLAGALGSSSATTYKVTPLGDGDFVTIQAAIDAAAPGDVIELADGVFTGAGNRNLEFRGKAITVRSRNDDPAACILDCQGQSARPGEPRRGFLFRGADGPSSVVRGITIAHGISAGK